MVMAPSIARRLPGEGCLGMADTTQALSVITYSNTDQAYDFPRTMANRVEALGIIISAPGNAPLRNVMDLDDDLSRMLQLLDSWKGATRTVSRIAVQKQLHRMSHYSQNMASNIDQYKSLFSRLERIDKDSAIADTGKAPKLWAIINQTCVLEATAATLGTKEASEFT